MDVAKSALIRWSETLSALARTGLSFTESLYEKERFEEVLHIAAEVSAYAQGHKDSDRYVEEIYEFWNNSVGKGIPGYVTPKAAIGAIVGNEKGEILLVRRSDSGIWLYPTGWADVGYSPAEIVAKEVLEETGIVAKPLRLLSVIDGMQRGFTTVPLYSMIFYCQAVGGELRPHPLECIDVGWFQQDSLPEPLPVRDKWVAMAFAAIRGEKTETYFDPPREPFWQSLSAES